MYNETYKPIHFTVLLKLDSNSVFITTPLLPDKLSIPLIGNSVNAAKFVSMITGFYRLELLFYLTKATQCNTIN